MAAKKHIKTKIGEIGIYDKSVVIPGIGSLYINDNIENIGRIIKECIQKAHDTGKSDKISEIKKVLNIH